MYLKKILFLSVTSAFLLSCTNDSASDLINIEPFPVVVSFNTNIKIIIDNNFTSFLCSIIISGTNLSLDTYEKVKEAVTNRNLIGRISMQEGSSTLMPQGGPKLPQNTIDLIIKWQEEGLLE